MPKWVIQIILAMVLGIIGQLVLKEGASKLDLSGGGGVTMMVWRMVQQSPNLSRPLILRGLLDLLDPGAEGETALTSLSDDRQ